LGSKRLVTTDVDGEVGHITQIVLEFLTNNQFKSVELKLSRDEACSSSRAGDKVLEP